ncbi:O-antigen ligase family protein [Alteriqipengyuania lutimaris]|uniref:O-antigen ligase-related domain-containing protein n=1 Tax=Alteriqipengyuania lutimaris TaxID=1538146 RepID=A0A395LPX4_9SPHN|nr:O-antigen ligase family protein [Alteriqipengyuania lutimaris]MBB3034337.1 O-antigen ligase [Alteriqipengyuania lutimaris]RDS76760.1 hypothetical protein DL238_03470 [Alteriqipengyuania lutimaris]
MRTRNPKNADLPATISFWLLTTFIAILWIAGGASRPDQLGQPLTRLAAWAILIPVFVLLPLPDLKRLKPVAILLGLSLLLVALQLVPLPPSMWGSLPGRDLFWQAALVSNEPQAWRPLSIVPEGTVNALGSLVVPCLFLALMAHFGRDQDWRLLTVILLAVVAGSLLGAIQFSGSRFENPLINDSAGLVTANFANRNHFALFAALGCLIAPTWGFAVGRQTKWKMVTSLALIPFFALIILSTGSRMGLVTGALGIALGLAAVRVPVSQELSRLSRPVAIALVVTAVAILIGGVILSIVLDRAYSVERSGIDVLAEDLRVEALPFVLQAIGRYFPVGAGFGTFDPIYRIMESDEVLRTSYMNEAHNDWLQVPLEGGLAGILLLLGAVGWWIYASIGAWFRSQATGALARVGSAALLLIMIASIVDYPARTPMVMGLVIVCAVWLARSGRNLTGRAADRGSKKRAE